MYNTTDSQEPFLPLETRLGVWDRQIYEAECLCQKGHFWCKPTLLKRPDENDDEYLLRSQLSFQNLVRCREIVEEQEGDRVYEAGSAFRYLICGDGISIRPSSN